MSKYEFRMNFHNFSIVFSRILMAQIMASSHLLEQNIVQPSVIGQECGSYSEVSMTSLLKLYIAELIGYFSQFTSYLVCFGMVWYEPLKLWEWIKLKIL